MKRITLLIIILLTIVSGCAPAAIEVPELVPTTFPAPHVTTSPTPTPEPTPEPTPVPTPIDPIQVMVEELTDRELIGQLVMAGFEGTRYPSDDFIMLMEEYKLANVILFGWNTNTFSQTAELTENVRKYNPIPEIPLFISTDVEGGSVVRFPEDWSPWLSSARTLMNNNDTQAAYEQFLYIGTELKNIGINMDLAPVLDISYNPDSTFMGNRIMGSDPEAAIPIAQACIQGLADANVVSVGKHFPGHGNTSADSHDVTPTIGTTFDEWEKYEKILFQAGVDAGIDGMLVGHLLFENIDENVSTLSSFFMTDVLQEDMGFEGIIMSDDMRMGGLTRIMSEGEAAVEFIKAGGDLVLIGRYIDKQTDVLDSLYEALQSGELTRERLEHSAYKIITKKLEVGE